MSQVYMSQARSKRRRVDPGTVYVNASQGNGGRIADVGYYKMKGKTYKPSKFVNGTLKQFTCSLGLRRDSWVAKVGDDVQEDVPNYPPTYGALYSKYMASEFNPGRAGCVPLVHDSGPKTGLLPMHLIDLNAICHIQAQNGSGSPAGSNIEDTTVAYPRTSTTQCEDVNSRFWIWCGDHEESPTSTVVSKGRWRTIPRQVVDSSALKDVTCAPRWTWDENDKRMVVGDKVYKRSIDIRMNLYGCSRLQTKFDVRVIRFLDDEMAPDYWGNLSSYSAGAFPAGNNTAEDKLTLFRDRWYSMVKPFVSNPLIKGLDRQDYPALNKKWFQTVYKKKVEISEVAGYGVDGGPPCATLSFTIPINEFQDLRWDSRSIKNKSTTMETYDETVGEKFKFDTQAINTTTYLVPPLNVTDNMVNDGGVRVAYNQHVKPHPKSRLYLLIRALAPMDTATTDVNDDMEDGNPTGGVNWNTPSPDGGFFQLDGLRPPYSASAAAWNDPGTHANDRSYDYTPSYDLVVRQHFLARDGVYGSHTVTVDPGQ